jgi:hypothetical protein
MNNTNKAHLCPIIIGIILLLIGLIIQVPGGALTTYELLDGDSTTNYTFDNKYSAIDEYVGGDAYNYIIGASLVAGKTAGTMVAKSVFIVGGSVCICLGITLALLKEKTIVNNPISTGTIEPTENLDIPADKEDSESSSESNQ